jgi:hypothetical protein
MPRKDVNEICVKLAGIDAKLDSIADLIKRHDETLESQDSRLRHVEKHVNVAMGWAGAIGLVASLIGSWVQEKLTGR